MELTAVWYGAVLFLLVGYFVLEGFDFGVGMLALRARDDGARGRMLGTIGPHWDGNETWLVVAGGAMFAAFPRWYADLTSRNYLALTGILVALIVRGVCLEYRGRRSDPVWRRRCELGIAVGSGIPPLLWGLILAGPIGSLVLSGSSGLQGWAYLRARLHGRSWWPFVGTSVTMACVVAWMVNDAAGFAVVERQAGSAYGLGVLTWAAALTMPFVLASQGWSYRVFRRRVTRVSS